MITIMRTSRDVLAPVSASSSWGVEIRLRRRKVGGGSAVLLCALHLGDFPPPLMQADSEWGLQGGARGPLSASVAALSATS